MEQNKGSKGLIGAGLISALAASLCCITPVLALVAGSSGLASTFSWLEPARPYLIGITALVLGFAWYQKLKPKTEIECDCEEDEKPTFIQSKNFLALVTIFAIIMTAFPYYSSVFYPETNSNIVIVNSEDVQMASFNISGMTCESCVHHIKNAFAQVPGYIESEASYIEGNAQVKYDKSKVSIDDLISAIDETGYKVTEYKVGEENSVQIN